MRRESRTRSKTMNDLSHPGEEDLVKEHGVQAGPVQQRLQLTRRIPLPRKMKDSIRLRAKNRCEDCGRPLAVTKHVTHPAVWAEAHLRVFEDYTCWKCHQPCTVVLVELGDTNIDPWLTDDAIGRDVNQLYPTFFWDYSRTLQTHYWANHCPNCGRLQGGNSIMEYNGPGKVVQLSGFRRKVEDAYGETREIRWGHFHHVDGNPTNNSTENILWLCVSCHDARHRSEPSSSPIKPGIVGRSKVVRVNENVRDDSCVCSHHRAPAEPDRSA